jgi:hypothetical protein
MSMFNRRNGMRFDPYGASQPEVLNEAPNLNALYGLPPQPVSGEVPGLQNPGLTPAPAAGLQTPGITPAPQGLPYMGGRAKRRTENFGPYRFD